MSSTCARDQLSLWLLVEQRFKRGHDFSQFVKARKWTGSSKKYKMGDAPKNPEIWGKVAMADHFEKIQKLKDKIEGVPNFRRVPGNESIIFDTLLKC